MHDFQNSITRAKQNRLFRCYRKLSYHLKQATLHAWLLLCVSCVVYQCLSAFGSNQFERHHCSRKPKTIMPGLLFFCRFVSPLPVCFFARLGRAFPESAALVGLAVFKRSLSSLISKRYLTSFFARLFEHVVAPSLTLLSMRR